MTARSCPSCLGALRRGSGARALYRNGKGVAFGTVCARCIARSVRMVLGAPNGPAAGSAAQRRPARARLRGPLARAVLGLDDEGAPS